MSFSVPSSTGAPSVNGTMTFIGGKVDFDWTGEVADVFSPIIDESTGSKVVIGRLSQMTDQHSMKALEAAEQVQHIDHRFISPTAALKPPELHLSERRGTRGRVHGRK